MFVSRRVVFPCVLLVATFASSAVDAQSASDALIPLPWSEAPSLVDDGEWPSLRTAIGRSLTYYGRRKPSATLRFGKRALSVAELSRGLRLLLTLLEDDPSPADLARRVRSRFELYQSSAKERVLFTGYYEPVIEASLKRRPGYDVPIYRMPPDLVEVDLARFGRGEARLRGRLAAGKVVPYWTRREIWKGQKLKGRGLELAWAKSWVDVFFVEVQGSGSLRLPDGTLKRFGYAGSNGQPYRSIGRLMIDEGKATGAKMSMQWLRTYLDANPSEIERVLCHNASVVFFRWLPGEPEGALGQPVTPGRSVATDLSLFPRGALAFVSTRRPKRNPDGTVGAGGTLRRFVLNQDTGGAIRGPGRVDFFWGRGKAEAESAGMLKHRGRIIFLVPRRAKLY